LTAKLSKIQPAINTGVETLRPPAEAPHSIVISATVNGQSSFLSRRARSCPPSHRDDRPAGVRKTRLSPEASAVKRPQARRARNFPAAALGTRPNVKVAARSSPPCCWRRVSLPLERAIFPRSTRPNSRADVPSAAKRIGGPPCCERRRLLPAACGHRRLAASTAAAARVPLQSVRRGSARPASRSQRPRSGRRFGA